MVALNTAYAAPKNAADPKNRVGDFFYEDHASVGKNRWASRLNTQEKSSYHYEIASGRSNWSNRDPIQEQGGLNLYAMVQNNPLGYWDYLGMSNCSESWWDKTKEVVSTVVDVVPVAGTVKSVVETVTGKDPITGEPVNRAVAAAGIGASLIPGGKAALKTGVKAASALSDGAKGAAKTVDQLSEAGKVIDKGGELTKAGRAAQKHGSRAGSAFPPTKGNPSSINSQGQNALDDILTSPNQSTKSNRYGGQDISSSDGRGARFDRDGNFMGFLEP